MEFFNENQQDKIEIKCKRMKLNSQKIVLKKKNKIEVLTSNF